MIIAIEGPDFVGKNTIVQKLIETAPKMIQNKEIKVLQFPNNETELGRICRKKLLEDNWSYQDGVIFQLLNTAHRYEYFDELKRAKEDPNFLLFVIRYNLSGPVYASVDGLDATNTWNLYAWFDFLLPDVTFIVSREFQFKELMKERKGGDHYELETKQEKVRKIYEVAETLWSDRLGKVHYLKNLDVETTVNQMIQSLIDNL